MSTLYVVEQVDTAGKGVCDVAGWLVLARDEDHAVALVEANGDDLEGEAVGLRATEAEWTREGDGPLPLVSSDTIHYGIWRPSDFTMAGYGFTPNDDWQYCGGCGVVREIEYEWTNGGDDCDECGATP